MFNPDMAVEVKDKWAEEREYSDKPQQDNNAFTFDDLDVWSVIKFRGRKMMITAKGERVHPAEGRQILLDAMDREQPQRYYLNEDWVNVWLNMRVMLAPLPSTMQRSDSK